MLLTKLSFKNYGPFSVPTVLELESEVTVLTGANDTGKTSLLTLIERVCGIKQKEQAIQDREVNVDRIGDSAAPWENDSEVCGEAVFAGTDFSEPHIGGDWGAGFEIALTFVLPPKCRSIQIQKWRKGGEAGRWSSGGSVNLKTLPSVIRLPSKDRIRPVIDMVNPNNSESAFLQTAFGPQFSFEKYSTMTDIAFYSLISKARGDLNDRLQSFLPPNISLEFDLQTIKGERQQLGIQLRDKHSAHTPLSLRGAGIQQLVSLMGSLMAAPLETGHYIILLDEPETSLHADAQHTLRKVLEGMARKANIQVVYATHSPSMINTMRPSSLRVLGRTKAGAKATSEIIERPSDGNFIAVRSSLGITAADSLLFAPVTLIVEGPTEVHCLPLALQRLNEAGQEGFDDVSQVLEQIHILDGCGDEFEYLCRLAKSQGTRPIIFLDGDKEQRVKGVRQKHPDVAIVLLNRGEEFEQIIPIETYFEALREVVGNASGILEKITLDAYRTWHTSANLPSQMAFTKRIDRWLQDNFDGVSLQKPLTMKKATLIVEPSRIQTAKLLDVIAEVKKRLES